MPHFSQNFITILSVFIKAEKKISGWVNGKGILKRTVIGKSKWIFPDWFKNSITPFCLGTDKFV